MREGTVEDEDLVEIGTVTRVANLINTIAPNCGCRTRLTAALANFADLERRRRSLRHLDNARSQRDAIVSLLELLRELDEFYAGEGDKAVYEETAMLFDDIAATAVMGARSLRRLATALDI
jgi:hypothetical protein